MVNKVAASTLIGNVLRTKLYKMCGVSINTNQIRGDVYFHSKHVHIGKNSFINMFTSIFSSIDERGIVTIGDNCQIAMHVLLCTHTHAIVNEDGRAGETEFYPITIEDGCWIGARAVILPGVRIGKGCIIAAGAVVNKNCEPNGLYAGVPARRIKDLL